MCRSAQRAHTRLSAAVLAMLAWLPPEIPVTPLPTEETDTASSSVVLPLKAEKVGALWRFSLHTRCFHDSAFCTLYMLY